MKKITHLLIFFFLSGYAVSQERQINTPDKIINRASDISLIQIEQDAMNVDLIEGSGGFAYGPPLIQATFECEIEQLFVFYNVANFGNEVICYNAFFQGLEPPGWGSFEIFDDCLYPGTNHSMNYSLALPIPVPPGIYSAYIIFTTNEPGNPQYIIPLTYTVLGGIQPIAEFTADQTYIYENDTVTFTDLSENNPASWQWSFLGGYPGSSTEQHPQVVYPYYGTYNVQLKVTNECGQDILFRSEYIFVDFASGERQPTHVSGFNVFPNPSDGIFYVDVPGEQQFRYKVLDLSGRVVTGSDWASNRLIDLSDKSPGFYFLKIIKTDYSSESMKIVVNP
jgi:hypothetical protein